jgi:hypothetical protein
MTGMLVDRRNSQDVARMPRVGVAEATDRAMAR